MNTIKLHWLPLILLTVAVSGCLRQQIFENEAVLRVNVDKIEISAEGKMVLDPDAQYETKIRDTVVVSCNRNFSSKIEPAVDWVTVESAGEINLSGTTREFPVVLVFSRNRADSPRTADLVLYSEQKAIRIPMTQSAPDYFFESTVDKEEVISLRDTSVVTILSNTRWTAELDMEQTDATATLTKVSGRDNGKIGVCFGYNFDLVNTRKAVVKIKPENIGKTFEYTIIQRNGEPFIVINQDDYTAAPEDAYLPFTITTNVEWKLSLEEEGFKGGKVVSLDSYLASTDNPKNWETRMEGSPAEGLRLAYIAEHGWDPGLSKKVKIKATITDGEDHDELTITQKGCIHLDFLDIVPEKAGMSDGYYKQHYNENSKETWPFEDPSWENRCKSYTAALDDERFYRFNGNFYGPQTYTVKGGYVMSVLAHPFDTAGQGGGGVWYNGNGFQVGFCTKADFGIYDYIETPAIEGMTLKKLILEPNYGKGSNTVWIRETDVLDEDGKLKPVEGFTAGWKYPKTGTARKEHELQFVHEFINSRENTSYRISFELKACCSNIKELVLIYE